MDIILVKKKSNNSISVKKYNYDFYFRKHTKKNVY